MGVKSQVERDDLWQARAVFRARVAHDATAAATVMARADLLRRRPERRLPREMRLAARAAVGRAVERYPRRRRLRRAATLLDGL